MRDAQPPAFPAGAAGGARGEASANEARLLAEIAGLGRTIDGVRAELAALRIDDIKDSHIPSATDELDAVVAHTAAATHAILESCEILDALAPALAGPPAAVMQETTTRIYEACGFQDITGQRITKVVSTLKVIEARVSLILLAFGSSGAAPGSSSAAPAAGLLNGPQMPASAMGQSEIDRLLASFE